MDVVFEFQDFLQFLGMGRPDIVADGKLHRFHIEGDKAGSKNGAYVLHLDGVPAGYYKNYKSGEEGTWSAKGREEMSEAERAALLANIQRQKAEREREEAEQHREAAARAERVWCDAVAVQDGHPYLNRKGVAAHGDVRVTVKAIKDGAADIPAGSLVLPVRSAADGAIQTLQSIFPEKLGSRDKHFLSGGKVAGGLIQVHGDVETATRIFLAEGYATACTVAEAEGDAADIAVVATLDTGNMAKVAAILKAKCPKAEFVICGDNDHGTEAKSGKNPGRAAAEKAAKMTGGRVALPPSAENVSDWNDYAALAGLEEVKKALAVPSLPPNEISLEEMLDPEDRIEAPAQGNSTPLSDKFFVGSHDGKHGVFFVEEKDGETSWTWVCTYAEPKALVRDNNGRSWGLLLRMRDREQQMKEIILHHRLFAGDEAEARREFMDNGGAIARGKGRARFADFILSAKPKDEFGRLVFCKLVNKAGWTADGKAFIRPNGEVIGESDGLVRFEDARQGEVLSSGTLDGWRSEVAALAEGNDVVAMGVCAAFAGALLEDSGLDGGGFNCKGASSSGKTTILKIATSVWNPPAVETWRGTLNSFEGTAARHNDSLLGVDELRLVDPREVIEAAYTLASGRGKGRADRNGRDRERRTWRVFLLSTGELTLEDHAATAGKRVHAGAGVRILDIEVTDYDHGCFQDLHGSRDGKEFAERLRLGAESHCGHAGPAMVEKILANRETIRREIRGDVDLFVRSAVPPDSGAQIMRGATLFGLIAYAGERATQWGITGWKEGTALNAAASMCRKWIEGRGGSGDRERREIMSHVVGLLERYGNSKFEPVVGDGQTVIDRWGFRDLADGVFLVLPEPFAAEFCKGFDKKIVLSVLRDAGILRCGEDAHVQFRKRLPGLGNVRVYRLALPQESGQEEGGAE